MSLKYYNAKEQIEYVGWLLACDANANIAKGQQYLNDLVNDDARDAALSHAESLTKRYEGVS